MSISLKNLMTLLFLLLIVFIDNINDFSPNLAFPIIVAKFNANISLSQWIINAYLMASASCLILGGWLGDKYGYRNIFLTGLVIFALSSLFITFAWDSASIILFRILQGVGFALTYPTLIILVRNLFERNQLVMAMVAITSVTGVSLAVGPSIGGWLMSHGGWKLVFLFNVPLAVIVLIWVSFFTKNEQATAKTLNINLSEIMILILIILSLTVSFNYFAYLLDHRNILIFLVTLIVFQFLVYTALVKRNKFSLIGAVILNIPNYIISCCIRMLTQGVLFVILFVLSIMMQNVLGFSVVKTSCTFLFMTVPLALFPVLINKFNRNITTGTFIKIGLLLVFLGCLGFGFNKKFMIDNIHLYLVLIGAGASLILPNVNVIAFRHLPEKESGYLTGVYYTAALLSGALCIALSGQFLYIGAKYFLLSKFRNNSILPDQLHSLIVIASGSDLITHIKPFASYSYESLRLIIKDIFFVNFIYLFRILNILAISAFCLTFLLQE